MVVGLVLDVLALDDLVVDLAPDDLLGHHQDVMAETVPDAMAETVPDVIAVVEPDVMVVVELDVKAVAELDVKAVAELVVTALMEPDEMEPKVPVETALTEPDEMELLHLRHHVVFPMPRPFVRMRYLD
jgi:hypothetical protein